MDRAALEAPAQVARQPGDGRRPDRDRGPLPALRPEDRQGGRRASEGGTPAMNGSYLLPHGRVLRYSFNERLMHWLAGGSYVYLLLTGPAFWSPRLYCVPTLEGGGP